MLFFHKSQSFLKHACNNYKGKNMNGLSLSPPIFQLFPLDFFQRDLLPRLDISIVRNICELNKEHSALLLKPKVLCYILSLIVPKEISFTPNHFSIPPVSLLNQSYEKLPLREGHVKLQLPYNKIKELEKFRFPKFENLKEVYITSSYDEIEKNMYQNPCSGQNHELKNSNNDFNQEKLADFEYAEIIEFPGHLSRWNINIKKIVCNPRLRQFSNIPFSAELKTEGKNYGKIIDNQLINKILLLNLGISPMKFIFSDFENKLSNVRVLTIYQSSAVGDIRDNFFSLLLTQMPSLEYLCISGVTIQALAFKSFSRFSCLKALAIEGDRQEGIIDAKRYSQSYVELPKYLVKVSSGMLEKLSQENTQLTHLRLKQLPKFKFKELKNLVNLVHLDLCSTQLADDMVKNLTKFFPCLRVLGVADTNRGWTFDHLESVLKDKKISCLDIRRTDAEITIALKTPLSVLQKISTLKMLSMEQSNCLRLKNKWSDNTTYPLPALVSNSFPFNQELIDN